MRTSKSTPKNIDAYIAGFPNDVQQILEKIRKTIRKAAPDAEETISYLNTDLHSEGQVSGLFCSLQETYRALSCAPGKREIQGRAISL